MESSRFVFTLLIIGNVMPHSIFNSDNCSGRWQITNKLNVRTTFDWQVLPQVNTLVIEFRTSLIQKGFWYAFGLSSSPDRPTVGLVYALRWREKDIETFWDIYQVTTTNVTVLEQRNSSGIIFQRSRSSGLLTVRLPFDSNSSVDEKQCLYLISMQGRFSDDRPLIPDEIRFNRSFCLSCQRFELTFTNTNLGMTTHLTTISNATSQSIDDISTQTVRLLDRNIVTSTSFQSASSSTKTEFKFIWFGRIINRAWTNNYRNLNSRESQNLHLDLQNLFLLLINHNSSFSFICNQFDLYSLQSGSILFASNITLLSNLTEDQTVNTIEELIKTVNSSNNYNLNFDPSAHHIKRTHELSQIHVLFDHFSRNAVDRDDERQIEVDSALHLLIGCIVSICGLMIIITSILCLYGYYKCRRRQFRLSSEQQTLKFKHESHSYAWLGQQQRSISSSPYLIQSTSI